MVTLLAALALAPKMSLVFADEFNKPGRPDPANWTFETGFSRNQELQWYQPENATVEGGKLIIEGRRERVKNPNFVEGSKDWRKNREFAEYTSACVKSPGLKEFLYGRIEVRAKIVPEKGLWPAIWTLGAKGPWPSNGEVDILEFYQDSILANTVFGVGGGTWDTGRIPFSHFTEKDKNWAKRFHTWRMDWTKESIKLTLDGELMNETDLSKTVNPDGKNPLQQPHYILLNLAIGSTGGDPSGTKFPTRYEVDYVRVYQEK